MFETPSFFYPYHFKYRLLCSKFSKCNYLDTFDNPNLTRFACVNNWAVSSVGLERYLDRVEVTGSNPVQLTATIKLKSQ